MGTDHPVGPDPQASEPTQLREVGIIDAADLEDVVGTDVDAVPLPLAAAWSMTGAKASAGAEHRSPGRSG